MAKGAKKKPDKKVAKKVKKPIYKLFEVKDGSVTRLTKSCPKCGTGFFMGKHKNRYTCGKCKYTVFGN